MSTSEKVFGFIIEPGDDPSMSRIITAMGQYETDDWENEIVTTVYQDKKYDFVGGDADRIEMAREIQRVYKGIIENGVQVRLSRGSAFISKEGKVESSTGMSAQDAEDTLAKLGASAPYITIHTLGNNYVSLPLQALLDHHGGGIRGYDYVGLHPILAAVLRAPYGLFSPGYVHEEAWDENGGLAGRYDSLNQIVTIDPVNTAKLCVMVASGLLAKKPAINKIVKTICHEETHRAEQLHGITYAGRWVTSDFDWSTTSGEGSEKLADDFAIWAWDAMRNEDDSRIIQNIEYEIDRDLEHLATLEDIKNCKQMVDDAWEEGYEILSTDRVEMNAVHPEDGIAIGLYIESRNEDVSMDDPEKWRKIKELCESHKLEYDYLEIGNIFRQVRVPAVNLNVGDFLYHAFVEWTMGEE